MSSKNQIEIRNSEGDTALLILLSIFAYEDIDVLGKTIIDSIDKNSAVKSKENILNNVLSKDKRFAITGSYKKTLTITAVRNEDSYGNLITKPISSQLKDIAELQSKVDSIITVDDIGSDTSARDLDLFFKKIDTMTNSDSDGNIFDNYAKLKGGKTKEANESKDDKSSDQSGKKIDPFEEPEIKKAEDQLPGKGDATNSGKNNSNEDKDGTKSDLNSEEDEHVPLSESDIKDGKKKEGIMKDNIPFYKGGLEDIKDDNFNVKSSNIKINKDDNSSTEGTKEEIDKDNADKESVIKDALPFTEFNVQKATDDINGTTSDKKKEKKDKKTNGKSLSESDTNIDKKLNPDEVIITDDTVDDKGDKDEE